MPHDIDHNAILDRLAATRGGVRNTIDSINPARIALLVIDMQNGFMEQGAPVEVPEARTIVGNINRLSAAVRQAGGLNVFVRFTTPGDGDPGWPVFYERMGPAADAHRAAFTPHAHYWQLWPELDVQSEDAVIDKCRFSAFTPGASGLDATLRGLGLDTVIVSGTLTNCCCESTARDAMQLNYRVMIAADANAALSDAEHAATLSIMAMVFADLHSTDELVALLQSPVAAQA